MITMDSISPEYQQLRSNQKKESVLKLMTILCSVLGKDVSYSDSEQMLDTITDHVNGKPWGAR